MSRGGILREAGYVDDAPRTVGEVIDSDPTLDDRVPMEENEARWVEAGQLAASLRQQRKVAAIAVLGMTASMFVIDPRLLAAYSRWPGLLVLVLVASTGAAAWRLARRAAVRAAWHSVEGAPHPATWSRIPSIVAAAGLTVLLSYPAVVAIIR